MEKGHTNYPSRYAAGEGVFLRFNGHKDIKWCKVKAIRFTESTLKYDIDVPVKIEGHPDSWTTIENVDNFHVIDEYKEDASLLESEAKLTACEARVKELKEAVNWVLNNCKPERDELHSDFFNILTNAVNP